MEKVSKVPEFSSIDAAAWQHSEQVCVVVSIQAAKMF